MELSNAVCLNERAEPRGCSTCRLPFHDQPLESVMARHRRVWSAKPALRAVYREYFRAIVQRLSPQRPTIEIGSGPGFFKEYYPVAIATDITAMPWIDCVLNGCRLPFAERSIGNLVLIDVFHHLARPAMPNSKQTRPVRRSARCARSPPPVPWSMPLPRNCLPTGISDAAVGNMTRRLRRPGEMAGPRSERFD